MSRQLSSSPDAQQRIDEVCDGFELAWREGRRQRIEDCLAEAGETDRTALLRQLVRVELQLRRAAGQAPVQREYEIRFPDYGEAIKDAFSLPTTVVENHSRSNADPPTPPLPMPNRIGRYQVQRELGGGTYGRVYLAYDDVMAIEVAIKVPSPRLMATTRAKEAFLNEVRSVAKLRHEAIVRVYDFGQEESGRCFIVYEYVEGRTLADRVRPGPLPPEEAVAIVATVADALHHAHVQGFVHRDVKPANILLDRQGRPRVADFGLAVREEQLAGQRGLVAGTYPYVSPEEVRREGHLIDGRTDVYSLGVVLYELLCGQRPFAALTNEEFDEQILHREVKPPRQIIDSIPRALEKVCLKALSKRVTDRYPTAKDMAEHVRQAMNPVKEPQSEPPGPLEIEQRLQSANPSELCQVLRALRHVGEVACVPQLFRCLAHVSEDVRAQARKTVHTLGWDKVATAAEQLANQGDAAGVAAVLDGLAAFESHPQTVRLLDSLVVKVQGDLRHRAIALLAKKRLGLELEKVAKLFRDIHSPYHIEKALGQGLFAAAYLASMEGTDLKVVVRVLRPEFASQPQVVVQFMDLGKQALQWVHENLVLTREARAFPDHATYFVVRDYVDGVTLQKVLEGGKRFEPAQIVRILRQIVTALGVIHRRGMSHGGIKPSNVFVSDGDRVTLGDAALPMHGIGLATERLSYEYRYAAPETLREVGTVARPADFYALGCVAYELACGRPPYVADSYVELAALHMQTMAVQQPSERGSHLGSFGDALLRRLLDKSPTERLAQIDKLLTWLDRLQGRCDRDLETMAFGRILWAKPPKGEAPDRSASSSKPAEKTDRAPTAPLVRDASLARYQGAESVVGFSASEASLQSDTGIGSDLLEQHCLKPLDSEPQPPRELGDYDVLEKIGSGGMGIVYKARDRRLNRVVALKVLPARVLGESPELRMRFNTEARAVASLQHPNIVQVFDVGEHEGVSYISLEFVGGETLAAKLRREGRMNPRMAAEMIATLAHAVHHAHQHGVIHRDLKPSNVLITEDGRLKIADFGLARMERLDDAVLTQSGMIMGTPAYMSPEQATGNVKGTGPATDVYSLGAILYEMLTGQPPFKAASVFETFSQLATQPVVPPRQLNPGVDRQLDAICLKTLAKLPKERYQTAADLASDLQRWLANEPVTAGGGGWWRALVRRVPFGRRG